MLERYSSIRDKKRQVDVIIRPSKDLCDFIETRGNFAILAERVSWRQAGAFDNTSRENMISPSVFWPNCAESGIRIEF
jgi:hypothetical protein